MNIMKQFLAASFAIMMIGTLSACATQEERVGTTDQGTTATERETAAETQDQAAGGMDTAADRTDQMGTTEREVGRTPAGTSTGTGTSGTQTNKVMDDQTIRNRLSQLQPGQKPFEYIETLSQYGTVTEYKLNKEKTKAELTLMGNNNKQYKLTMDVQPENYQVSDIRTPGQKQGM